MPDGTMASLEGDCHTITPRPPPFTLSTLRTLSPGRYNLTRPPEESGTKPGVSAHQQTRNLPPILG